MARTNAANSLVSASIALIQSAGMRAHFEAHRGTLLPLAQARIAAGGANASALAFSTWLTLVALG